MNLYILRHGIAEPQNSSKYPDDSKRPLTDEGKKETRKIAEQIKKLDLDIELVLSSPFVRTRQTAEIFCEELGLSKKLNFEPLLESGRSPKDFLKKGLPDKEVLIVGHEPFLSELISLLTAHHAYAAIDMKKAGFARVEITSKSANTCQGVLKWLLTPKLLKALR